MKKYNHKIVETKWPATAKTGSGKQKIKVYSHLSIERKWQGIWERNRPWKTKFPANKKKFYGLIEFPYPSGDGLHVGHIRSNTAMDIISRKRRAEGFNVLYPIGWDAFGLPTENYAIKTGLPPSVVTKKNTDTFRRQLKSLGFSFDWSREINTTDPKYYKWTQWMFLQFYKKGLAYKAKMPINWCLNCKIGLANEEVVDGTCERCSGPTEKREKEQWMIAITKYADRLHKDLDKVDYPSRVKIQQRNWIGRSVGAEIEFKVKETKEVIKVFTTRSDTLFGATYVVLSPEHPLIEKVKDKVSNWAEVGSYVHLGKAKKEIDRTAEGREKTGVELKSVKAINPANGEELPIYVADYVLSNYGTGAIMAVPAHDQRDFEFAKKFSLSIKEVIVPNRIDEKNPPIRGKKYVERKNVQAIVRNPKNNTYLILKWKKQSWTTFPMGGIENNEDIVEAAKREVTEETGYKNLKFVKVLGGQIRAEYFAAHKDQNRVAFTNAVMFDLLDEEKTEVSQEEAESYEVDWIPKTEIVYPKIVHAELNDWLERWDKENYAYTGGGILINSGKFNGLESEAAKKEILKLVHGKLKVSYKLRDWVFSRQRYWGEPIPLIICPKCGYVPVPEKDLPLKLPVVKKYEPTENGESPLATITSWVNIKCPKCKGPAKRETDTMPNWAGSSWYFLRYTDSKNNREFASKAALKYFTPVDWYNGGMEHTTLHLLYSRFWHKFLFDQKLVPTSEPYKKRTSHGLILAEGGVKMSKSKGNVVNPDQIVKVFGADSLRLYEMFMGPFEQAIAWNSDGVVGTSRFIERVWRLQERLENKESRIKSQELETLVHQTIKKVSEDIESLKMNTAVSQLMILTNELEKQALIMVQHYKILLRLLAPFTPHFIEEIWQILGEKKSIHSAPWPKVDKKKIEQKFFIIGVSINGKRRGEVKVHSSATEEQVLKLAINDESVKKWLISPLKRHIYIAGKIINLVI